MSRRKSVVELSDLQVAVMRVLWEQDEATVAEVHAALLKSRGLALTTIATTLKRLEARGVVDHRTDGRLFVYRPLLDEDAVRTSMLSALTDRLFRGDPAAVVNHLLEERDIDSQELKRLKALIDARQRASKRGRS